MPSCSRRTREHSALPKNISSLAEINLRLCNFGPYIYCAGTHFELFYACDWCAKLVLILADQPVPARSAFLQPVIFFILKIIYIYIYFVCQKIFLCYFPSANSFRYCFFLFLCTKSRSVSRKYHCLRPYKGCKASMK